MKLSKAAPQESPAQKNNKQKTTKKSPAIRIRLLGLFVGLLLGLLLAVLSALVIYDKQVVQLKQQQLKTLAKQNAELAAASLEDYLHGIERKLAFFVEQSSVKTALQEGDAAMLASVSARLKQQIPVAAHIHFIEPGLANTDASFVPPIRYSELAMFRKAEDGQSPAPEALKHDGRWLLSMVAPVMGEQQFSGGQAQAKEVLALLWLTTQIEQLPALLQGERAQQGEYILVQNFGPSARVEVTRYGVSDLELSERAQIADSHWQIEYRAHSSQLKNTHVGLTFVALAIFGAGLLCIVFCAALGFVIGRQIELVVNRRKMAASMHGVSSTSGDAYIDPMYQTQNILDVQVREGDEALLSMEDDSGDGSSAADVDEELALDDDVFDMHDDETARFAEEVFRAYDIRGIAEAQINKEFAVALGKALGTEVLQLRQSTIVVARDARLSSPQLTEWLVRGILSTGCNVLNIGTVPTPLMYFALATMDEFSCGVMVTASHNAAQFNGFKIVLDGVARSGEDILALRKRMLSADFLKGEGQEHHHDVVSNYIDTIFSDVALAGEMTVVIDAGNGVAGKVAPQLFEELGCRVVPLYCDLDGNFPNHDPDPSREANLQDLIARVKDSGADLGIALDGDGDRLTVVSGSGEIVWADRLLILFARDILSRSPGADVVFDVKSTRHLNAEIAQAGGRPIMWKTGHSLMKQKMLETGAVVGAEYSGHIFIKDRWFGFDDGMYAAARLLELLSLQGENVDEAFADIPTSLATPEIRVAVDEARKFLIVDELKEKGEFSGARLNTIDGLRVDFAYGWALVRASNTSAELTLRFEADDEEKLHQLKAMLVGELRKIDKDIEVNWDQ
ncbi:phosphomannomutase/phosphoglucomutase [Agaribacterium haliotis]|uniref:phosphomannomutase/phosphoglucomutase n=1 Tax=Agaribacterium haliotis TaxID=2013869 RepID=UPI000BB58044|nr:phosphomannomutase/phosphoglucomutase [Agaribacterium haliotis]